MLRPFEQPEFVDFFVHHRNAPEDLYRSEMHFLPGLARNARSVLDVGCAAGGFTQIWRAFNPTLAYTGVDISDAAIEAARELHPGDTFIVGDATTALPLPDGAADVVAALGWLHWEPRYRTALAELWRLAERSLFFDVRLRSGPTDIVGEQHVPGGGDIPYICVSWPAFQETLQELDPGAIRVFGYLGPPAATVRGMPRQVCHATIVLDRVPTHKSSLDLPFAVDGALI